MRVIDLAIKDLRQITRDRKSFLFLLLMPLIFTVLFGFAFGGADTADPRLPIGVMDEDQSELSRHIVAALAQSEVVRIETDDTAAVGLEAQVADESLAAAIIIPAGFEAQMKARAFANKDGWQPVRLVATGQTAFTVESEVQTAVSRLAAAIMGAQINTEAAERHGVIAGDAIAQTYFDDALRRSLAAWDEPSVTITRTTVSALTEEAADANTTYNAYAHSSPGMMAQFAVAGLMGAAGILVVEKKTGSLKRLLTTNMTRGQILLGHFLAMVVMVFLQISVLILFGQLVLKLPYFSQPLATLLLTLATAIFSAGLGLLIGVMARSEEQVIVLALIPMFVLSALGGAWVPLEFTPEVYQQVAFLTPLAWVIDGYKDILVRGQGVEAVGTSVLVLLAFAAAAAGVAVWRFSRE